MVLDHLRDAASEVVGWEVTSLVLDPKGTAFVPPAVGKYPTSKGYPAIL